MRGVRVDKVKKMRYDITHFGHWAQGIGSKTLEMMSEKDFKNLYAQMGVFIKEIEERESKDRESS